MLVLYYGLPIAYVIQIVILYISEWYKFHFEKEEEAPLEVCQLNDLNFKGDTFTLRNHNHHYKKKWI
jgi:hypothetical protein